jgi:hypothetical protein
VKPFSERSGSEILLSTPAAIFYCTVAVEFYRVLGSPEGWLALTVVGAGFVLRSSIALWIEADAHKGGRSTAYDLGSFVFFLPLVGLIYLLARYGWAGFRPLGWCLLLVLGGIVCAWLPNLIVFMIAGHLPTT